MILWFGIYCVCCISYNSVFWIICLLILLFILKNYFYWQWLFFLLGYFRGTLNLAFSYFKKRYMCLWFCIWSIFVFYSYHYHRWTVGCFGEHFLFSWASYSHIPPSLTFRIIYSSSSFILPFGVREDFWTHLCF